MSTSLYRKYRPKTFAEVIGQDHVKMTLQSELEHDRLAHAYLFSGPRGLGKTTIARLMAKALNCRHRAAGTSEPCNRCEACDEVNRGNSIDVIEIDAASHTGVDNVRENIVASARFTPTTGKYKVFIIDEVHMLSTSAFNALLKTLEEPPAHAIFILATTELHRLPQTIVSRCQRFDFRKVTRETLIKRLKELVSKEKKSVDAEVLETVVRAAEGCVRDAETLLGQLLTLDDKHITTQQVSLVIPTARFDAALELIGYLQAKTAPSGLTLINRLTQEGVDLTQFTNDTIEVLRKLLLIKVNPQLDEFTNGLNQALASQAIELGQLLALKELVLMLNRFIKARQELKSASISQLPLEIAIVEICANDQNLDNQPPLIHTTESTAPVANDKSAPLAAAPPPPRPSAISPPNEKNEQAAKPTAKKPTQKIRLSLEQIRGRWEEVLVLLKTYNHSLASTLRLHQPTAVSAEGKLEIPCKYRFHQQRINDTKNRQTLEQVLENIFGTPLQIQTVLIEEVSQGVGSSAAAISKLADAFGGQVVD